MKSGREAMDALSVALLALAERGELPACVRWPDGNPWLSEDVEIRAEAAQACTGCPVMAACDRAAVESQVTFGVWAGRDRTGRAAR